MPDISFCIVARHRGESHQKHHCDIDLPAGNILLVIFEALEIQVNGIIHELENGWSDVTKYWHAGQIVQEEVRADVEKGLPAGQLHQKLDPPFVKILDRGIRTFPVTIFSSRMAIRQAVEIKLGRGIAKA